MFLKENPDCHIFPDSRQVPQAAPFNTQEFCNWQEQISEETLSLQVIALLLLNV
jgi:hypothetical protein